MNNPNGIATWFIRFTGAGAYIGPGFTPDGTLPDDAIACGEATAAASGPWTTLVKGVIAPGAPPAPSSAVQANAALNAGCQIASASTSALNGTYPTDPGTISNIQAEMISILANGMFADGTAALEWADTSGNWHAFTIPQFKSFATAIAAWVSALKKMGATDAGTLPAQPVPIP